MMSAGTEPENGYPDSTLDWTEIAEALADAAKTVLDDARINSEVVRAEGVRYLTRMLASAGATEMESDPAYPHLQRLYTPWLNWGMPCPDGTYCHAVLDGEYEYRVSGRKGTAHVFVAEIYRGSFSESPDFTVVANRADFEVEPNGEFEIILSRDEREGNWMQLPPGPAMLLIREFFYDWDNETPAELLIERIGESYPPPPTTIADLRSSFDRYLSFLRRVTSSMALGAANHYRAPADRLPYPPLAGSFAAGGLRQQYYGQGYYTCELDQAVILEMKPPDCHYWMVALTSQYWEMADWLTRQTSLNGHQARLDDDGCFRAVIAHHDPGVPNWLDAGHRTFGLLGSRCLLSETEPEMTIRVVPFGDLRGVLPAATPTIAPDERQEQLRRRMRVLRKRFGP